MVLIIIMVLIIVVDDDNNDDCSDFEVTDNYYSGIEKLLLMS
jgi:hypothetical protein